MMPSNSWKKLEGFGRLSISEWGGEHHESHKTSSAPAAIGPYSQGIVAGDLLFISGQIPVDPETGEMALGGIEEKTHQVLKNIRSVAEAAGTNLSRVVKTTVFLKDMADFQAVNSVYAQHFDATLPARSAIQVAGLPKEAPIEIETIIYLGE